MSGGAGRPGAGPWRPWAVGLLLAALAVRASPWQTAADSSPALLADPAGALRSATAMTAPGGLGAFSASGLREAPLALLAAAGEAVGLPLHAVQAGWRVAVLLVAFAGALRVARLVVPAGPWSWPAALVATVNPLLVHLTLTRPLDALAVALLPWVAWSLARAAHAATTRVDARPQDPPWSVPMLPAALVGVAGVASPAWAVTLLVVAVAGTLALVRTAPGAAVRGLAAALAASAWWLVLLAATARYGVRREQLLDRPDGVERLAPVLGLQEGNGLLAGALVAVPVLVTLLGVRTLPTGAVRSGALLAVLGGATLVAVDVLGLVGSGAWPPWPVWDVGADGTAVTAAEVGVALLVVAAIPAWAGVLRWLAGRGLPSPWVGDTRLAATRSATFAVALLLLAGAAVPGVVAASEREPGAAALPAPWAELAVWSAAAPPGRTLVVPPSQDHARQQLVARALAGRDWVSRSPLPTAGGAATRAVDAALSRLVRGDGGDGTRALLERLGVRFVVLAPAGEDDGTPGATTGLVRSALVQAGDATRLEVLGPAAADGPTSGFGARTGDDRVEVWEVPDPALARWHPGPPLTVVGEQGAVAQLAELDLLSGAALDLAAPGAPAALLTDSGRRQDVDQRRVLDPVGPVREPGSAVTSVPGDATAPATATQVVTGTRGVRASSSAADVDGSPRRQDSPAAAALDGDPLTAWQSRRGATVGESWEVDLEGGVDLRDAVVTFLDSPFVGPRVSAVLVETDTTSSTREVLPGGRLYLDLAGSATRLRLTVVDVDGRTTASSSVGISEVTVPGWATVPRLDVAASPRPDGWVLTSAQDSRRRCVPLTPTGGGWAGACDPALFVGGADRRRLDRLLQVGSATPVQAEVRVVASASQAAADAVDAALAPTVRVQASSSLVGDLAARPQAAADGDPTTTWRPEVGDPAPSLTLSWGAPTTTRGVQLTAGPGVPASAPTRVRVELADQVLTRDVGPRGTVSWPPVTTDRVVVTVLQDDGRTDVDPATAALRRLPVAVSEVAVLGGPQTSVAAAARVDVPCGGGPTLTVAGQDVATSVSASVRDLLEGEVVAARPCGDVPVLPAGAVDVSVRPSFLWTPVAVALLTGGAARGGGREQPVVTPPGPRWSAAVPGSSGVLALATGAPGWVASTEAGPLETVVVDGWRTGWVVPAGVHRVDLRQTPVTDVLPLVAGAGAGLLGVVVALLRARAGARRAKRIAGSSTQR